MFYLLINETGQRVGHHYTALADVTCSTERESG